MKKLSFLPILLLAVLLMVGCNEETRKAQEKKTERKGDINLFHRRKARKAIRRMARPLYLVN